MVFFNFLAVVMIKFQIKSENILQRFNNYQDSCNIIQYYTVNKMILFYCHVLFICLLQELTKSISMPFYFTVDPINTILCCFECIYEYLDFSLSILC